MTQKFSIGSEWLYYKIYMGYQTTDTVLLRYLQPIINQLKKEKRIKKWFFIRYNDPEPHIRLRFLVNNVSSIGTIVELLHKKTKPLLQNDVIWNIQTDTYERELERYGHNFIEISETLFEYSSENTLAFIKQKPNFTAVEQLLYGMLAVEIFLRSFGFTQQEKFNFTALLRESFRKEFEVDKNLNAEMNQFYNQHAHAIILAIQEPFMFCQIFKTLNKQLLKEAKTCQKKPTFSFFSSHIHMIINRLYTSKQRNHELLIYEFLYKYYKTAHYKN